MPRRPTALQVCELESRLTPASTLDFIDVDGDRVSITATRGDLSGKGTFDAGSPGDTLMLLDLTDSGFQGADIATLVTRAPTGDGLVNIGRIDATGRDLGTVTVRGDLGVIDAGDGDPATPALKRLKVRSMGRYGLATQNGTGDLESNVNGTLGALRVAGDVREAIINVTDSGGATGRVGPVYIGGSLVGGSADRSGSITARDGMGPVTIRGDLIGGAGTTAGAVACTTNLAGVTVGGSVLGGSGASSGTIFSARGTVGPVLIAGDLAAGPGVNTGRVFAATRLAGVTVGGSVLGGPLGDSGKIHSDGDIGPVRIGRDLVGGQGSGSGRIFAAGELAGVTVGGSLVGDAREAGEIVSQGDMGVVRVGRDVRGGPGTLSGRIRAGGTLAGLALGGSLVGGTGLDSGQIDSRGELGPVRIGGDVFGGGANGGGFIRAGDPFGDPVQIASVTIGGSLVGGGGDSTGRITSRGDIGPVVIGGDLRGGAGGSSGVIDAGGRVVAVTIGGSVVGAGFGTGVISAPGDLGPVRIAGDLTGGRGGTSGFIFTRGNLAGLTVGGSVIGGTASSTGAVLVSGALGPVRIGHDLRGGNVSGTQPTLDSSGYIQGDRIASVFVGGSIISGVDSSTQGDLVRNASIRAENDIGDIVVRGSLVGNRTIDSFSPVVISARGQGILLNGQTTDLAIKSLTVGGRVEFALVLAGFGPNDFATTGSNGNASIGPVTVFGDWVASSLSAGVRDADRNGFGTAGDVLLNKPADPVVARIVSVTIGGMVAGSSGFGDHFGFTAQRIGSFRAGAFAAPLTTGPDVIELSPTTGDVTIREV